MNNKSDKDMCKDCEFNVDGICDLTGISIEETICHYEERKEMEQDIMSSIVKERYNRY